MLTKSDLKKAGYIVGLSPLEALEVLCKQELKPVKTKPTQEPGSYFEEELNKHARYNITWAGKTITAWVVPIDEYKTILRKGTSEEKKRYQAVFNNEMMLITRTNEYRFHHAIIEVAAWAVPGRSLYHSRLPLDKKRFCFVL